MSVKQMSNKGTSYSMFLDTNKQDIKSIAGIISELGAMADCLSCGRIARLKVDFLGDPGEKLQQFGVNSLRTFER